MKKMLSLAAMFAALSYASPAFAALNISGDASVRVQDWITGHQDVDNVDWQYRLNLRAAADLGDGYFFKALVTNEDSRNGGWQTVGYANGEVYNLQLSQFYFGHMSSGSHYLVGRLPLNSANNPIFDLTLFPTRPIFTPIDLLLNDRAFGANVGGKVGPGDLNATFVVLDNNAAGNTSLSGDGLLNDGYGIHTSYKFNLGNVTFEPQAVAILTKSDVLTQTWTPGASYSTTYSTNNPAATPIHFGFRPVTYGTNVSVPLSGVKLSASAFYTRGSGTTPAGAGTLATPNPFAGTRVDYFGDFFRIKAESGPVTVWYDHNSTTDKSTLPPGGNQVYTNNFIYAQYKIKLHESAQGTFTLQPTVRYASMKTSSLGTELVNEHALLPELWATVTF